MDALDQFSPADDGGKRREVKGGTGHDEHGEQDGIGPMDRPFHTVEAVEQPGPFLLG